MKKLLKAMTAALVVSTALMVSVSAANFDHCADALKGMGLFQGSAQGYELDRAPTRAEAATMLVRLLGKEADAKKLTYTAPFTDLEGWEQPYVQYLFDNKLTAGATATTFDPAAKCDAKMYTTFLLRALNYDDTKGDFTYDTSISKAIEIGLNDGVNCEEGNFLRDHVAAMSYTALAEQPKGETKTTLLEKLVADGAVTKEQAAPMMTYMDNYVALAEANAKYAKETKTSMTMDSVIKTSMNGAPYAVATSNMKVVGEMDIKDMNKSKISAVGKTKTEIAKELLKEGDQAVVETTMTNYYTDGMSYSMVGKDKMKMPMDFSGVQSEMMMNTSEIPFTSLKSLTVKTEGNVKTFAASYAPNVMNSMVNAVLPALKMEETSQMNMNMKELSMNMIITGDVITGMDMAMKMSMAVDTMSMDMDMTAKYTDIKVGGDIKVVLPADLATYTLITASPAA